MAERDVYIELQRIVDDIEFAEKTEDLTESWIGAGLDIAAVESILKFMEDNGSLDYGMPGPLVHYVEQYFGKGYETLLVQSVSRTPTTHTLWMLNRLINGTKDVAAREAYIRVLEIAQSTATEPSVADAAKHFLKVQMSG